MRTRHRTGPRARVAAVLLALGLVAAACSGSSSDDPEDTTTTDAAASPTADDTSSEGASSSDDATDDAAPTGDVADVVRIGLGNFPASAVPWSGVGSPGQYVWSALFDALTVIGEDGTAQPALAESWESIDETTWEFTLREGVEFHNGEPLDADAVVATFDYLYSEEGSAQFAAHVGNHGDLVDTVTALDEGTVEVTTTEPNVLLPNVLSIVYIVPPEDFADKGVEAFATEPVGTGPYAATSWGPQSIELERWEDSWREAVIPSVAFTDLSDPAARVQALQSGQVDLIISAAPDQVVELENAGFESYISSSGRLMSLMFISTDGGPLESTEVRQALNYAVDKEAINEQLLAGFSAPAAWPPQGTGGYDESRDPYPYDPEMAASLLEEAGYGDGFEISAEVTLGAFPADREVYEAVAGYLSEVGVTLELNEIDFASDWLPKFQGSAEWEGDAFGSTWVAPPLMDAIRPFAWNSCGWPNEWFCDEQAEELVNEVNSTFDVDQRDDVLAQLLDRNMENPPSLFLIDLVELWVHSPDLSGWEVNAFNPTWDTLTLQG